VGGGGGGACLLAGLPAELLDEIGIWEVDPDAERSCEAKGQSDVPTHAESRDNHREEDGEKDEAFDGEVLHKLSFGDGFRRLYRRRARIMGPYWTAAIPTPVKTMMSMTAHPGSCGRIWRAGSIMDGKNSAAAIKTRKTRDALMASSFVWRLVGRDCRRVA